MAAFYGQPVVAPILAPPIEPKKSKGRLIVSTVCSSVLILSYLSLLIYVMTLSFEKNTFIIMSSLIIIGIGSLPLISLCASYETWKCLKIVYSVVFVLSIIYYLMIAMWLAVFKAFFNAVEWTLISDYLGVVWTYLTATFFLFLGAYLPLLCLYSYANGGYHSMPPPIYVPPIVAQPYVGVPIQANFGQPPVQPEPQDGMKGAPAKNVY